MRSSGYWRWQRGGYSGRDRPAPPRVRRTGALNRRPIRAQEEDWRRRAHYEQVKVERDKLAAEFADIYPIFAQKLAELLPRVVANDREIEFVNAHALPNGGERLL